MAQDADNDNPARSAVDAVRAAAPGWSSYGAGGTALQASSAAVEPEQNPSIEPTYDDAEDDAVAAPGMPEMAGDDRGSPAGAVAPQAGAAAQAAPHPPAPAHTPPRFSVTEASSLAELGIDVPRKPMPQRPAREPALRQAPPPDAALANSRRRAAAPQMAAPSADSAHLFNRQPNTETGSKADAFANAAFSAGAPKPERRSVTSQPGFVFGLISAAMVGAALYIYLA